MRVHKRSGAHDKLNELVVLARRPCGLRHECAGVADGQRSQRPCSGWSAGARERVSRAAAIGGRSIEPEACCSAAELRDVASLCRLPARGRCERRAAGACRTVGWLSAAMLMTHAEAVGGLVTTAVTALPCHRRQYPSRSSGGARHCGKLGVGFVEWEGAAGRARRPHHTVASVAMRHRRHRMATHGR